MNAVQAVYLLVWTSLWISVALVVSVLTGRQDVALRMARRIWAPGLRWAAGMKLDVEPLPAGVDWSRPHVFAMNHQSMLDVVAAFIVIPTNLRFLAKHVLKYIPFLGWYMSATGMIFVNRDKHGSAKGRLEEAAARMRAGASILVYPEGTRSADGFVGSFKGGAFVLAALAGVPVVPVAIDGSGRCLPRDGFRPRPGVVRMKVGEPIAPTGTGRGEVAALTREVRRALGELHLSIGGKGVRPDGRDDVASSDDARHEGENAEEKQKRESPNFAV